MVFDVDKAFSEHREGYSPRERGGASQSGVGGKTVLEVVPPTSRGKGQEGILPSTRSRDYVDWGDFRHHFLAGNGESLKGCGVWMWRGCLEYEKHSHGIVGTQNTLFGARASRVGVVEVYKASCGRLSCPICYEKACAKEAVKIEHRILSFRIKGRKLKAIHVVVSPSEKDIMVLDFPSLRKKAYKIAMRCGVFGGSIIFHPFRLYNEDDRREDLKNGFGWKNAPSSWYISPHFHIIGYGWVRHVKQNYEIFGWVVKNLGVRKSIRATAHYQLSHCGVNKRFHTIVWFGALSYNKLRVPRVPDQEHPCPLCKNEMRKVKFVDEGLRCIVESSLENEGVFYVDEGLFVYSDESDKFSGASRG